MTRRTTPLPRGWARIRAAVLERDAHRCRIRGPRCMVVANDVDHLGAPDDHRLEVLQAACTPCHATKTGQQGRARQPNRQRAPEQHPGVIRRDRAAK